MFSLLAIGLQQNQCSQRGLYHLKIALTNVRDKPFDETNVGYRLTNEDSCTGCSVCLVCMSRVFTQMLKVLQREGR